MTTTSTINSHARRPVMTVVLTALLACAAPTAALAVPPGPNAATAGAGVDHPAGPC
jgi:hypothetical protein